MNKVAMLGVLLAKQAASESQENPALTVVKGIGAAGLGGATGMGLSLLLDEGMKRYGGMPKGISPAIARYALPAAGAATGMGALLYQASLAEKLREALGKRNDKPQP